MKRNEVSNNVVALFAVVVIVLSVFVTMSTLTHFSGPDTVYVGTDGVGFGESVSTVGVGMGVEKPFGSAAVGLTVEESN